MCNHFNFILLFFSLDVDARPWDFQAEECSLRAAVDRFNNRHYGNDFLENTAEDDDLRPVDNDTLSVLGQKVELGEDFKNNYQHWLEREVFSVDIDWDQLCTCKNKQNVDS
jgi:hypothetical protein